MHGRITEKIGDEIRSNEKTAIMNKMIRIALKELGVEIENEELLNTKPDIVMKERTRVTILDVACPCDLHIS